MKFLKLILEFALYLAAAYLFWHVRAPLIGAWWMDLQSDAALVGTMANDTLHGHFPIFYYGQNYMGGAEWLTAAWLAKLQGLSEVPLSLMRWNSFSWFAAAAVAWVAVARYFSRWLAVLMAFFFGAGNYVFLQMAWAQELTAPYLFLGAVLVGVLLLAKDLRGARGLAFGLLLGISWWTNQTVVFFFLPALWFFQAQPAGFLKWPVVKAFARYEPRMKVFYGIGAVLVAIGAVLAMAGGFRGEIFGKLVKFPNGVKFAKDVITVLVVLQAAFLLMPKAAKRERALALEFLKQAWPFVAGFLIGFSPVWLGRIFGLYEKNYGISVGIFPVFEWGNQFRALMMNLDNLIFSSALQSLLGFGPYAIFLFLVLAIAALFAAVSRTKLGQLALVIFLLNSIYVCLADRAGGAPARYLYPAMIGFWLLFGAALLSIKPKAIRALASVAVIALVAWWGQAQSQRLVVEAAASEHRKENLLSVISLVEAKGAQYCWGDYWTAYLLNFLGHDRVIYSPHPAAPDSQVREGWQHAKVLEANPNCYVSRKDGSSFSEIVFSETNPWVK